MKFSTIVAAVLGAGTIVSAAATPFVATLSTPEFEVDISERGIVDSLISGVEAEIPKLLGSIDYESIAGYVNRLLTEDDNAKYLDDLLIGLKDLNILAPATLYLIEYNYTRHILGDLLSNGLQLLEGANSTGLWVALDRSGLAYGILAGVLEDPQLFPFAIDLVRDVLDSGVISFGNILLAAESAVGGAIKSLYKRDDLIARRMEPAYSYIQKRDNIDDLLTTIFSSVERSGLIENLISSLLSNPQFEDESAILVEDFIRGFQISSVTSFNLTQYRPLINSIAASGLLGNTLRRALSDQDLLNALVKDVGSLFRSGNITSRDLVSREVAEQYGLGATYDTQVRGVPLSDYLIVRAENVSSTSSTSSQASSSSSKSSSTATSSSSSGAGSTIAAKVSGSCLFSALLRASAFTIIMLI